MGRGQPPKKAERTEEGGHTVRKGSGGLVQSGKGVCRGFTHVQPVPHQIPPVPCPVPKCPKLSVWWLKSRGVKSKTEKVAHGIITNHTILGAVVVWWSIMPQVKNHHVTAQHHHANSHLSLGRPVTMRAKLHVSQWYGGGGSSAGNWVGTRAWVGWLVCPNKCLSLPVSLGEWVRCQQPPNSHPRNGWGWEMRPACPSNAQLSHPGGGPKKSCPCPSCPSATAWGWLLPRSFWWGWWGYVACPVPVCHRGGWGWGLGVV